MNIHSKKGHPSALGKILHAKVNRDKELCVFFSDTDPLNAGVSFNKDESGIIIQAVAQYIGELLFSDGK